MTEPAALEVVTGVDIATGRINGVRFLEGDALARA